MQIRLKLVYFIGLLSPVIWMLVDYRISGNPFFSSTVTLHYTKAFLTPIVHFGRYWAYLSVIIIPWFNSIAVFLAFIALLVWWRIDGVRNPTMVMLTGMVVSILLFYWISCLGHITLYYRFFMAPVCLLYFTLFYTADRLLVIFRPFLKKAILIAATFALVASSVPFKALASIRSFQDREACCVHTISKMTAILRQYMSKTGIDKVIIQGTWAGVSIMNLGEDLSKKSTYFCDVNIDSRAFPVPSIMMYRTDYLHSDGHWVLDLAVRYRLRAPLSWRGYRLTPVYFLSNKQGALYKVEKG